MKAITKIFKILFGFTLFVFGVCSMAIAPNFTPGYFSESILRVTELIMAYMAVHGISIIVWAVKNQNPIHDFRIEIPHEKLANGNG